MCESKKIFFRSFFLFLMMVSCMIGNAKAKDIPQYTVNQSEIKIDGKLNEWANCPEIPLNKLKDAGKALPAKEDSNGYAKVAWNEKEPSRLYFAFVLEDNQEQFDRPNSTWWYNDTVEVLVEMPDGKLVQWALNGNGRDIYGGANKDNTAWKVVKEGKKYFYEFAVDLSKFNTSISEIMDEKGSLRVSLQYNDGENDLREHQMGWTEGDTWNVANFGKLIFSGGNGQAAAVNPLDRIVVHHIGVAQAMISGDYQGEKVTLVYSDQKDFGEDLSKWEKQVELKAPNFAFSFNALKPGAKYYYRLTTRAKGQRVWATPRSFITYQNIALDTKFFSVMVNFKEARWSVLDKTHQIFVENISPDFKISDLPLDLNSYLAKVKVQKNLKTKYGLVDLISTTYSKEKELEIIYNLFFLKNSADIIVRTDFVNYCPKKIKVSKVSTARCEGIYFNGDSSETVVIGDAKQYSDYYSINKISEMNEVKEFYWYTALQQKISKQALAFGNLTNEKGIGKFSVNKGTNGGIIVDAYNDYEKIMMPEEAKIAGEPLLMSFRKQGIDTLEQFGTLIAQHYQVNVKKSHPIKLDDPVSLNQFNLYSQYGSGVIDNYPTYSHQKEKHQHAYEDPDWVKRNEKATLNLGFKDFGYYLDNSNKYYECLVRNYGKPDFWFPEAQAIYNENKSLYIDEKADFSNPELLALEKGRAKKAAKTAGKKPLLYGFDFANQWSRLPGQADPFMTSAETFREGAKPWHELAKKNGSPYSIGSSYMSVIGFLYDLMDLVRIGADSDHGYNSGGGCTFITGLTRQISGRWFYNGKLWWNNPDTFHVYAGGLYTKNMGKVHATYCAITGNRNQIGEPFADQRTPEDRLEIIRKISPMTEDTAIAVDMFEHNSARLWNMPIIRSFDKWNVVSLFNLDENNSNKTITEKISFDDLNLSLEKEYLVYEFWNQKFLGVFRKEFTRTLSAIDCEVYSIVESKGHPQLISTTRHVRQMAYDMINLKWDAKAKKLTGTSRVTKNYPQELIVYLPEGYQLLSAVAGKEKLATTIEGSILRVKLVSDKDKQDWVLSFK